jgi:hypothetical protein
VSFLDEWWKWYPLAPTQMNEYPYDETRIYKGVYVRVVGDSSHNGYIPSEWQAAIDHAKELL